MFKNRLKQIFSLMLREKEHFYISYAVLMHCTKIDKWFRNVNLYIQEDDKMRIIFS